MIDETDLEPIWAAMKYRLKEINGLGAYDYVPGAAEWPAAFLSGATVDHEGLADDWITVMFDIVLLVSAAFDVHQLKLLAYQSGTGPKSIPRVFRQDPTLGGLVGDIRIIGSRPLGYEEQAGYQGWGCVFEAKARIG